MNVTINKPDFLGAFTGALCLVHCLTTPFLFAALAGGAGFSGEAPFWWVSINYIFLVISFFAVLRTVQTTSGSLMKPLFWISWVLLSFVLINEQFGWVELSELASYVAASVLIVLHLYNRRYCQCETDNCCLENG